MDCHRAANRKYNRTEKCKARERKYRSAYLINKKRQIKERLVAFFGGECSVCHLKDPCLSVYDFHHKDPGQKDLGIAQMLSWKQAFAEAAKCSLVCSNCHRRIHADLRNKKVLGA